tara:strand:- start:7517 stop:7696 length:180 start_codon:yes stop_codon:yes gene_type:complete
MWMAFIKALLDWLTALVKEDTKASDADSVPKSLKDKWRKRIEEQEQKSKQNEEDVNTSK